jgi:hypothetical protein
MLYELNKEAILILQVHDKWPSRIKKFETMVGVFSMNVGDVLNVHELIKMSRVMQMKL